MKDDILYNNFLEEIARRIPDKTSIVNVISDMLSISKDAGYRRLRGDVPFSFDEVMKISRELDISLDSLERSETTDTKHPFKLKLIEYMNPVNADFSLMEEIIIILKHLKDIPEAKGGEITSILPQPLYVAHENIFRFYLFKSQYQSNYKNRAIPYKDIVISEGTRRIHEENIRWARYLDTEYIFDANIFSSLVANIKYFYHIGLITLEEVYLIQQDLSKIINEIDKLTLNGSFKETGRKISIYISKINIDTSYCYICSPDYNLKIVKAHLINGIASSDKESLDELKSWAESIKKHSTLINADNPQARIDFLKEQREIINGLLPV